MLFITVPGFRDIGHTTFGADITDLPNDLIKPMAGGVANIMSVTGTNIVSLFYHMCTMKHNTHLHY